MSESLLNDVTPDNANPEITWQGVIGEQGALNDNWKELLPEDLRHEPCLNSIKNFSALAQSYVHAQHKIGSNRITLPGENASEAEINEFYNSLGRPDKPEGYQYQVDPATLPEGVQFFDELLANFKSEAHKLGLTPNQFKGICDYQKNLMAEQLNTNQLAVTQQRDIQYNESLKQLKTEYGNELPIILKQYQNAANEYGLADVLKSAGLDNNLDVIKALARIGEGLGEAVIPGSAATADSVQGRLDTIINDPNHAYYKADHPAHNRAVAEVARLLTLTSKSR